MYYLNENIKNLKRIYDQNKRAGYLRLDLNENPGGLCQELIDETLRDVTPEFLSQYPETLGFSQTLAGYLGTDSEHICLVNGSAEGMRYIIEAFSSPGGQIVGVTPTFAMVEVYAAMYSRRFISVPYADDLEMPVERILRRLTPEVELLILLNPNNPLGNVYSEEDMARLLEAARANEITVLIDEAYHYFYPHTFLRYALENEHVFVTRTFSKLFSIAGCRLGYIVGQPEGIATVQKLCTPHNVNAFGMLFAKKIIESEGLIERLMSLHREGKEYLLSSLAAHGYTCVHGEGNFVFIQTKEDADLLVKRLKEQAGILVKSYPGVGKLGKCLRVTTGERQYMERFLAALYALDARDREDRP